MKKGMVINKRQILLAVLVLALAVAVYLNWYFSKNDGNFDISGALTASSGSYIGDAQYVNNPTGSQVSGEDYFAKARTGRTAAREEGLKILKEVVDDVKSDSSAVADATQKAVQLAKDAETESAVESLVKAKGFADCVAVISDGQINVIVKTDGLLSSDTVQIQDIAASQTGFALDKIKILEVK